MLLDWIARRRIAAFEKKFGYDMGYGRDLLALSRKAFWRFALVQPMAQLRDGVPLAAWYAAKIVAARAEDCGACVQLVVDMARADGVPDAVLRAVLRADPAALDADGGLGYRYARAVVCRDAEVPSLRDEIIARWGTEALASLAVTLTASRMFPMLKCALGHGRACGLVRVGDEMVPAPSVRIAQHAPAA